MSWFIDIANKAEDLLNQVDKTAASALQNKQKIVYGDPLPLHKPKFYNKGSTSETLQIEPTFSSTENTQLYRDTLLKTTKDKIRQSHTKSLSFQNKRPESDDEKLMEFLNSSDDIPLGSARDTSIPKSVKLDGTTNMSKPADFVNNKPEATDFLSNEVKEVEHVQEAVTETIQKNLPVPTTPPEMESEMKSSSAVNVSGHSPENELSASENVKENLKTTNFSDCTLENKFLLENDTEGNVLRQDLLAVQKRAEQAEAERKRMQKKLEHWNSQISGNDKQVKELMEREADLKAAIDAKDSQLAVLKVRLQEADQALTIKSIAVEDLKCESERLVKDQTNTAIHHNQIVQTLQEKLQNVEHELHREKENYHASQTEHFQRMNKMEEEQNNLAGNFRDMQKRLSEVKEKNKEFISQLKSTSGLLENLQEEYADYKQKAQRILQSKERLIMSLKDSNTEFDSNANESLHSILCAEIDELKQERDLLREELRKASDSIETYKTEVQDLEKISQNDSDNAREHFRNLEEQLRMEKLYKEELELLNGQLKEELKFLREDLSRSKSSFQSRIQDREIEIEKLRRQLMAKSLSTVSQDELESRLHALTENLIQKQTIVEALSTEKNSLVLQLERLEQQLKEAQSYGSQHHTVVGVLNPHESDRKLKSNLFTENPFDSSLTRKVKRMYGSIDAFSVRLGVFFRRYPVARVFVIIYMLLLHLWVMIVLLTYQPEIHNYGKEENKRS